MREFTKALFSYSLAASLFSLQQVQNMLVPRSSGDDEGAATKAFEGVTHATLDQFDGTLKAAFRVLDNVQRGLVNLSFGYVTPTLRLGRWSRDAESPAGPWHSDPDEPYASELR